MNQLVFIGLGANLNNPSQQIISATKALCHLPSSEVVASSSLYASKPLGPQDQPDYVNSVVSLTTQLTAVELLLALQNIELTAGRIRKAERWGARTLDLDILLFGHEIITTELLTVPHYDMKRREFVIYPLAEIANDLVLPCGTPVKALKHSLDKNELEIFQQIDLNALKSN